MLFSFWASSLLGTARLRRTATYTTGRGRRTNITSNMNAFLQTLLFTSLVAVFVKAQAPANSYLPPSSGGGGGGYPASGGGDEGGKPEPFSFSYEVKDDASGNDYSHKADSDGTKVTGEYQVLLPDGRRQKVSYTADDGGYNADVQYEGEAKFPSGNGGGSGGGSGGGYPSGGPSGGSAPGGGYPSGPASRPGGSYLPPGK